MVFNVFGRVSNAFSMGFQCILNEFPIDFGWIALYFQWNSHAISIDVGRIPHGFLMDSERFLKGFPHGFRMDFPCITMDLEGGSIAS